MTRDASRLVELLAGWGVPVPVGAVGDLERLAREWRGEARMTPKQIADDMTCGVARIYSMRQYGRRVSDPLFNDGLASRREVEDWLRRHPEWKVTWRRVTKCHNLRR